MDRSIEGVFNYEGYEIQVQIKDAKLVEFTYIHNGNPMTSTWVAHDTAATLVDNLIAEGYIRHG